MNCRRRTKFSDLEALGDVLPAPSIKFWNFDTFLELSFFISNLFFLSIGNVFSMCNSPKPRKLET